jgi:spermidine/putrescine-binding protein
MKNVLLTDEQKSTRINLLRGWVGIWTLLISSCSVHAGEVLHLYNWNNYISEQTIARFEAQCACRVAQDYYSDN